MAASDALPIPKKNTAYRVTFPILDADGDLVTAAGSLDSEVSKDGGTFADCSNEATEIATASGMYFLDLTAAELNTSSSAVIVKSTNGKTTPLVFYPEEAGDIRVDVTEVKGATAPDLVGSRFDASVGAVAADAIDDAGVAADLDTYQAKVWLVDDDSGGKDHYMFAFFKNGKQITSGVTVPTVWVYSAFASPVDLVGTSGSPQTLTEAGSTETWFHTEGSNRIVSGTPYFARVRFTVDGTEREWTQPVGRDSSV